MTDFFVRADVNTGRNLPDEEAQELDAETERLDKPSQPEPAAPNEITLPRAA